MIEVFFIIMLPTSGECAWPDVTQEGLQGGPMGSHDE